MKMNYSQYGFIGNINWQIIALIMWETNCNLYIIFSNFYVNQKKIKYDSKRNKKKC